MMVQKRKKRFVMSFCWLFVALCLCGCSGATREDTNKKESNPSMNAGGAAPQIPEQLKKNEQGIPVLQVYVTDDEKTEEMDIETYLQGVVAGEMKNDWPMEALKAQAILARTFVLKFCSEKKSRYAGADISTDIEEAQAYDATGVNDRIEQAIAETAGQVLSQNGELPYAWFHAHSGGMTARAKEGLAYEKDEPGYTKVTEGRESEQAPENAKAWEASFSANEVLAAAQKAGYSGKESIDSLEIGERGESGRAITLSLNGTPVSAPEIRIALGSSKMRSTLLTSLKIEGEQVVMTGKGYGHGVGMPQWGAYALAEEGKKAEEIVLNYFQNITVERLW